MLSIKIKCTSRVKKYLSRYVTRNEYSLNFEEFNVEAVEDILNDLLKINGLKRFFKDYENFKTLHFYSEDIMVLNSICILFAQYKLNITLN